MTDAGKVTLVACSWASLAVLESDVEELHRRILVETPADRVGLSYTMDGDAALFSVLGDDERDVDLWVYEDTPEMFSYVADHAGRTWQGVLPIAEYAVIGAWLRGRGELAGEVTK